VLLNLLTCTWVDIAETAEAWERAVKLTVSLRVVRAACRHSISPCEELLIIVLLAVTLLGGGYRSPARDQVGWEKAARCSSGLALPSVGNKLLMRENLSLCW